MPSGQDAHAAARAAMRVAVLTLSDRGAAGEREDLSGEIIVEQMTTFGAEIIEKRILPDDEEALRAALIDLADLRGAEVIITTGGTGLGPRDVTPETTLAIIDRRIPGMEEAMRRAGAAHTPFAMLSRGVCGMRGKTIIINLPGSPKGVREGLEVVAPVLRHAVELAQSPAVADSAHTEI
jgi:molybdenum cofactor synthesis domain-containing protein